MTETRRLYKFYNREYGVKNLRSRRLKISTLEDLNDPFELNYLAFPSRDLRKKWKTFVSELMQDKGIICFSKNWSNPVIWSHYAEKHQGIALGFDVPIDHLIKVEYRKTRKPFTGIVGQSIQQRVQTIKSAMGTKFAHWEYEQEYRVFCDLNFQDAGTNLFFKEFDQNMVLREIIIGPSSNLRSKDLLSHLNEKQRVKIKTARLAFSKFKVVERKDSRYSK